MHVATDLPGITNEDEAIGALYVLEGSTLGGKIISAMIKKVLIDADDSILSFYNGYGEESEKMWSSFTNAMNEHSKGEEQSRTITEAAKETFVKFKAWALAQQKSKLHDETATIKH